MNWKDILTSVVSVSVIFALIQYFIKQSFKKYLDKKIEESKEEIRQKGKLFDIQFEKYIVLNALVYRSRNAARDILYMIKKEKDVNGIRESIYNLSSFNNSLINILFENKAILTLDIYHKAHQLKSAINELLIEAEKVHSKLISGKTDIYPKLKKYEELFENVDDLFEDINKIIQEKIGVK